MAEMAVSLAREKLLPLIRDEANLLWDIPKEFADIKDELEYIQAFLKDADRRAAEEGDNTNEGIRTWVKQLREASFRIEDVIDEYMIYVEQQPHDPGCAALLCEIIHFIETLMPRHQIASEIQQIKSFVHGIKQRGKDYHFQIQPSVEQGQSSYRGSRSVQWHDPRMHSRYLDEADVVGFEGPRDELIELWGQIESATLDDKTGSRILITTRKKDVADSFKSSHFDHAHELKPLTLEKSMELFCKKTFRFDYNGCCPDHLMNISSEFVKKCKGLPLAIVAIGGLLSGKEKTTFEWERIRQGLSSEMEKNYHLIGVTKILGFSYDDLPYYLKSCLLYFGIYPEDYEVKSTRLIRQWIAEGFVKDEEGKTLEDVVQQYLTELIGRSLVQVPSFTIDGKARSCHVHDLLRDMILRKFKDLSFCQHINKEDESMSSGMIRRLSIANISNDLMGSTESSHTRSLLVFTGEESALTNEFAQRIPTKYRLLKGNLAHLKYLSLKGSWIQTENILKFIGKLQNLETLDLRFSSRFSEEMPKEICKLTKLRHLLGDEMNLFQLKNSLGDGGLQRLKELHLKDFYNLKSINIDKGALCSLETLQFFNIPQLETVPPGIQHLEKLEVFDVYHMPYEFEQCIAPDGGPEHPSIQHVPLVRIDGKKSTR
ncbi:putative disease resistance RPP13 protein 3 [Spatholobus suberectus]|nr:putative disease resistance RPP13 protein 3 [Spatholobus suberectus]